MPCGCVRWSAETRGYYTSRWNWHTGSPNFSPIFPGYGTFRHGCWRSRWHSIVVIQNSVGPGSVRRSTCFAGRGCGPILTAWKSTGNFHICSGSRSASFRTKLPRTTRGVCASAGRPSSVIRRGEMHPVILKFSTALPDLPIRSGSCRRGS